MRARSGASVLLLLALLGSAERAVFPCDKGPCVKGLGEQKRERHRLHVEDLASLPHSRAPLDLPSGPASPGAHGAPASLLEARLRWEVSVGALAAVAAPHHAARSTLLLASLVLIPMIVLVSTQGNGQQAKGSKYRTFIATQGRPEAFATWQVVVRGLVISAPCICSGYNIALLSAELPSLEAEFGGHSSMLGWVAATYCAGCIAGSLVEAFLVERHGRLRMHRWLSAGLYLAQALMLAAPTFSAFLLGRFLMGAACGAACSLAPLYTAEISPKDIRGLLVSLTEWTTVCGLIIGYALTVFPGMTFRGHALIGILCPLAALLLAPLLSESPRWLAQQGRVEEARGILELYVQDPDEAAQTALSLGAKAGTGTSPHPGDQISRLLCDAEQRSRLFWPACLMAFEEMVGTEVSDDYCMRFLGDAGVPNRSLITSLTVAAVAVKALGLATSGCLLDCFGRKPWLTISLAAQTLSLCIMSLAYTNGWWGVVVASWIVFNFGCGTGVGNVSLVVMAESFPDPSIRVASMCFCYVLNRAVAAVLTGIYPMQHTLIGTSNVFLVWASCAAVATAATMVFMTERVGTILEHA